MNKQEKPDQGPNSQTLSRAEQIALDLIARGIAPVPVPVGEEPTLKRWQLLRITAAEVPRYFIGQAAMSAR